MENFKELIEYLKIELKINSDKELAEKLGLTSGSFSERKRTNSIPNNKIIDLCVKENLDLNRIYRKNVNDSGVLNSGNNNKTNENNSINIHGNVHINNVEQQDKELCEIIKQLDPKQKEYYYHLMKADLLKKNL